MDSFSGLIEWAGRERGALGRRGFLASLAAVSAGMLASSIPGSTSAAPRPTALEREVDRYVKDLRRRGRMRPDEETSWSVYDFTSGEKLVSINEDVPRQAASMIKPFVAAAFFYEVERGRFRYGPRSRRLMRSMLQLSSNSAANKLIDIVGHGSADPPRHVERILKRHAPGVFVQTRIVEKIPVGGRSYRNRASAHDYSRFLYALWQGGIPRATEIRRLMSLPNRDRLYDGARKVPIGTEVVDKTGTTARLCGDMGILVGQGRDGRRYPYTLIGIVERDTSAPHFGTWIRERGDVIRGVSNLVYAHMKRAYPLL